MEKQRRYLVIGAHPDDCEMAGGIALKLIERGHKVKFLTATNGFSGHHEHMGGEITNIRRKEAERVSALFGVEYEFLDNNDAFLTTDLATREKMLVAIRGWAPDVIITHRPNDYHPDHRNTSILVQDCSYLVQVPNVAPLTPVLRYQPAIFYAQDHFLKPYPFEPTIVVDVSDCIDEKVRMYQQYASQFFEWIPWVDNYAGTIPEDDEARFEWLKKEIEWLVGGSGGNIRPDGSVPFADRWQDKLRARYGDKAKDIKYVEGLELCEYGAQPDLDAINELFPF